MQKEIKLEFEEIKQLIHIADIHIRNLKRHKEYKDVFKKFFSYVKKEKSLVPETIILIAGDIVHAKTDMSPELIELTGAFLTGCANLCPTILIPGNHDANLNNQSRLDALSPIVKLLHHPNLFYFKKNDIYRVADTDFAVFSVLDKSPYPLATECTSKNKIAISHGPVDCAKTDVGFKIESKTTINTFDGFDIVCLGDIHRMQSLNDKKTIAFPGSLIQQNQGESLNKGFLVWNVPKREYKFVELPNDYGYYTLRLEEPKLPDELNLPKHTQLRLQVDRNMLKADIKSILSELRTRFNITNVVVNTIIDKQNPNEWMTGFDVIGNVYDVSYQNNLINEYLSAKGVFLDDDEFEIIYEINKRLNNQLKIKEVNNIIWEPVYLKFSNMFSYGEDNFIDFTKIKGINGIFAENAHGKSSIISILLFLLGNKSFRTTRSVDVMNVNKKYFHSEFCFKINDIKYFIQKQAKRVKAANNKETVQVFVDFWTEDDSGNKVSLNGDQRRTTDENIYDVVGGIDNLILTAISLQNNSNGIIDKSQSERKMILSSFLGIDIFEDLYNLGNDKSKEIGALIKEFSKKDYDEELSSINKRIQINKKKLQQTEKKIESLELVKSTSNSNIISLSKKLVKIESIIDINQLRKELSNNEDTLKSIGDDINDLKKKIETVIINAQTLASEFKKYNEDELKNKEECLDNLEKSITNLDKKFSVLNVEIKHQEEKLKKLDKLEYDPNCNFCMNNIFVKDAIETKKNYSENLINLNTLKSQIEEIKTNISSSSNIKEERRAFTLIKESKDKLRVSYNKFILEQNVLIERQNYQNKIKEDIERKIQFYHENEKAIKENEFIQEKISRFQNKLKITENELNFILTENRTVHGEIKVLQTQREEIMKTIDRIHELEKEYKLFEYYLKAIHRNSIPYELIKKVVPVLESETNNILSQIVEFNNLINLDDNHINLYIVYEDKYWVLELTSGMEKFISSLAIRIALMRISNIPKPNFLIIDEGFSSLDSNNINQLNVLFEYLKNYFEFVLVISHLDSMRDMIDNVIELKLEKGFSKIWHE